LGCQLTRLKPRSRHLAAETCSDYEGKFILFPKKQEDGWMGGRVGVGALGLGLMIIKSNMWLRFGEVCMLVEWLSMGMELG